MNKTPEPFPPIGYSPQAGIYDEAFYSDGKVRPYWNRFLQEFAGIPADNLSRRWDMARQVIRSNGVTYNVYSDQLGNERPWQLDPIPLIVPNEEWQCLEKALIQRAVLLNRILMDCYGEQKLLLGGLLPPALIYSHPGFLRSCRGLPVPGNQYLTLYSADIARSPDGRWWVVSDRTQAPSGMGYALENRTAISRMLPDIYQNCAVRSLGHFFREIRESLVNLAPRNRNNPRIALLTPGPFNEVYFEHSYLARQLGFILVQGEDLTVRDDQVFLKTVNGLMPVDVILRRVDDDFCDPLELRNDSFLGVPGLVNAVRSGNVAVANVLGSGLIQNPAIMPFLPGLCRHILGEDLLMPCVATWWCGQKTAYSEVFSNLDHLVVRSTLNHSSGSAIFGQYLSPEEKVLLAQKISAQPYYYIGQEQIDLSTTPVWTPGGIESRSVMLRVHLVAKGDSYAVMPGGLTRVTSEAHTSTISMQSGAGSKDTWILSEKWDSHLPPTISHLPVQIRRGGNDLPSRLADNLFWLGRYLERTESHSRLIRTLINYTMQESPTSEESDLQPFLQYTERIMVPADMNLKASNGTLDSYLVAATFDPQVNGGIKSSVYHAGRILRSTRECFSTDAWKILLEIEQQLRPPQMYNRAQLGETLATLETLLTLLFSFSGMQHENMTRNQGWRFLDIGRRVERGIFCFEIARVLLNSLRPDNPISLEAALGINDCDMLYRSRYFSDPSLLPVLDLLLIDEGNPRSAAFQLAHLQSHFNALPHNPQESSSTSIEQKVVLGTLTAIRLMDISSFSENQREIAIQRIQNVLYTLSQEMPRLSELITTNFFSHSQSTYRADQILPIVGIHD